MIKLSPEQSLSLRSWFLPDKPGVLLGLHALNSRLGIYYVDQWPEPRVLLAETTGNFSLVGDVEYLSTGDLTDLITGVLDAPLSFLPLLQEAFPDLEIWDRIIFSLEADLQVSSNCAFPIRPLVNEDSQQLLDLSEGAAWISKTWNGPEGLANSGYAWAAFDDDRIISVACSFFVGDSYEDIGVVTEADYRGQGVSTACSHALCRDIITRGRKPCWSTSTGNEASKRIAEKLGFNYVRHDRLYAINQPIPSLE